MYNNPSFTHFDIHPTVRFRLPTVILDICHIRENAVHDVDLCISIWKKSNLNTAACGPVYGWAYVICRECQSDPNPRATVRQSHHTLIGDDRQIERMTSKDAS